MIHAKYCYDSNPIDKWFEEEIAIEDLLYWHLERFFEPDRIGLQDKAYWEFYVHWGGYRITLGERLNQPVRAVLNAPGIWVPDPLETFALGSEIVLELNDVEVYRRSSDVFVDKSKEWAAMCLSGNGPVAAQMTLGEGAGPNTPEMLGLEGPILDIVLLAQRGGTPSGKGIEFMAAALPGRATGTINEIGLFTQNRIMIAREQLARPIVKDVADKLVIRWLVTIN